MLRRWLRAGGIPAHPISVLAMVWWRLRGLCPRGLRDEDVARLRCPLLVVCPADDSIVPCSHGQRIAEAATDGTLLVIPNGGHLDVHVVDPQRHDQALRVFVERVQDAVS